jgi:hypothetical protein
VNAMPSSSAGGRLQRLGTLMFGFALLAGCTRSSYEVDLRSDGDGLVRTLTVWREPVGEQAGKPNVAAEELQRIADLYDERLTAPDAERHKFRGRFTAEMPIDVGGSGRFLRLGSDLGGACTYVERFRGVEDIDAQVVARRLAADRLAELLLGWFESELGGEPSFPALRTFIHQELRGDLRSMALYGWLANAAADQRPDGHQPEGGVELLVRGGQFLVDRGYLQLTDLPGLVRAVRQPDGQRLGEYAARLVADKLGVPRDQHLPASLDFLTDPARLQASLESYVRTTPEFAARKTSWEQERLSNPDAPPPQPVEVISTAFSDGLIDVRLFHHPDVLSVRLTCPVEPFSSNGQWDGEQRAMTWSGSADLKDPWPTFCFAFWSEPAINFQQRHFGRVVLQGQPLAEYVVWRQALSADEAAEWDAFIGGLRPGPELASRIALFRFSYEQAAATPPEQSLADPPRQLLLAGLQTASP